MRVAFALALLGCVAALAPCPAPAVVGPASVHRCSCDPGTACCCRGESRRAPASEPGTPVTKSGPEHPADLATGAPAAASAIAPYAAHWSAARLVGGEPGPAFLTARSFRC